MYINARNINANIENFYILTISLSFIYGSILSSIFEFPRLTIWLYVFSYLVLFCKFLINPKLNLSRDITFYSSIGLMLLPLSFFFWKTTYSINSYLGLIAAFLIFTFNIRTSFFIKILKVSTYVILLLTIYEYFVKEYLFIDEVIVNGKVILMDEKLFGGKDQVFRAKSVFSGPLTLAQFATGIAFVFKKNIKLLLAALMICLLSNARLGLLIVVGIIIVKYIPFILSLKINRKIIVWFLLIVFFIVLITPFIIDQQSIGRFLEIFNTSNKGNFKRMEYWMDGITVYLDYNLVHKIFGNNGYFRSIYNNNAENGWITLLLENGVLGFLYYLFPLLLISVLSIIKKTTHVLLILLIFLSMFVQTYYMGSSTNLIYWFVIFYYYTELKANRLYEKKT